MSIVTLLTTNSILLNRNVAGLKCGYFAGAPEIPVIADKLKFIIKFEIILLLSFISKINYMIRIVAGMLKELLLFKI